MTLHWFVGQVLKTSQDSIAESCSPATLLSRNVSTSREESTVECERLPWLNCIWLIKCLMLVYVFNMMHIMGVVFTANFSRFFWENGTINAFPASTIYYTNARKRADEMSGSTLLATSFHLKSTGWSSVLSCRGGCCQSLQLTSNSGCQGKLPWVKKSGWQCNIECTPSVSTFQ